MGTAEIESALVSHPKVNESAVVGFPHEIKGQGIYAYVTLMIGEEPSPDLKDELVNYVRKAIGPIASPDAIQWAPDAANVTNDLVAALNQRVPTVQITPPQGWRPRQESLSAQQTVSQVLLGVAQQQAAQQAAQQQQQTAQPTGR